MDQGLVDLGPFLEISSQLLVEDEWLSGRTRKLSLQVELFDQNLSVLESRFFLFSGLGGFSFSLFSFAKIVFFLGKGKYLVFGFLGLLLALRLLPFLAVLAVADGVGGCAVYVGLPGEILLLFIILIVVVETPLLLLDTEVELILSFELRLLEVEV